MDLDYYLDNVSRAQPIGKETAVYATVRRKPYVVKVRTGLRIEPRYWDKEKQSCKRTYPDVVAANHFLADMRRRILSLLMSLSGKNISKEELKSEIKKLVFCELPVGEQKSFFDCFQ